jgi:hypothetical protein
MTQPFTTDIPIYVIRGGDSCQFNVFNKRSKAIKNAIKMATQYSGTSFQVIEKRNWEEKVIFSINLDVSHKFEDIQTFYQAMLEIFKSKLSKTRFWRKTDEGCP